MAEPHGDDMGASQGDVWAGGGGAAAGGPPIGADIDTLPLTYTSLPEFGYAVDRLALRQQKQVSGHVARYRIPLSYGVVLLVVSYHVSHNVCNC